MDSSPMESLDTFIGITGASQAVAIRMLQDNGGDLNAAVNAFFNERDPSLPSEEPERVDYMDEDEPAAAAAAVAVPESRSPPWGLARPVFDPLRSLFERPPTLNPDGAAPIVSHPREIRDVPIEWREAAAPALPPNLSIREVSADENAGDLPHAGHGGIVSMEDDLPPFPYPQRSPERDPFTPQVADVPSVPTVDYEVEEEMMQAALEASIRDAERRNDSAGDAQAAAPVTEDDEIARAVSLSLKTAEDEKRWRDLVYDDAGVPITEDARRRENPVSSSVTPVTAVATDPDEPEEQPLLRRRSSRRIGQVPVAEVAEPQPNGDMLPSDEWGGISTEEHDEAVMLEAVFGGGLSGLPYPLQREFDPLTVATEAAAAAAAAAADARRQIPQPLSPTVVAQRLLREQQDDEFLASLAADREKELKAKQEAEAASQQERLRREEEQRKSQAEAELERKLAAKAESLPPEPTLEDDSAVTILVRLPDGSRHGRRFRKSDKLQNLFDFIDLSRAVKVGSYRLVRQYPRRTYTNEENGVSLDSLGLTNKQEALFLEMI